MRVLRTERLFIYFIYWFIYICLYTVKNHQVGKFTARRHGKYFGALERNSPWGCLRIKFYLYLRQLRIAGKNEISGDLASSGLLETNCWSKTLEISKYFGLMDAKLVFFKNSFNAYVSQSYFCVRFVPFNLLSELPTFGFQDFSWYLEFVVLKYVNLCVVFIQELLDTSWKRRHCVWFVLSLFFVAI